LIQISKYGAVMFVRACIAWVPGVPEDGTHSFKFPTQALVVIQIWIDFLCDDMTKNEIS
jgi:hypothetical protein